jgi:hypothetical protein
MRRNCSLSLPSAFEKRHQLLKILHQKIEIILQYFNKDLVNKLKAPTFALPIKKGDFFAGKK